MAEPLSLPQLLRSTREQLGLSADELAIRSGVARAHLLELERGSASSFYSLKYCKQAVMGYARALGIEDEANKRWSEADWTLREDPNTRSSSQADPPIIPLTSQSRSEARLPGAAWIYQSIFVAVILVVVGISLFRLNEPEVRPAAPVVLTTAPVEGGASTAPAAPPFVAPPPAAPLVVAVTPAPSAASAEQKPVSVRPPPVEREVQAAFERWLSLWNARQADPYLAMFDPTFPDLQAYRENRRRRMQSAQFIEVKAEQVSYRVTGPNEVTVQFVQAYRSDTFSSRDTKELVWRQSPTGPKIIAERRVN